ncbi:hypothetical protein AM10699_62960 (plasmid) [Acaryochloris marina MBIC10699]|nr:hypothetical protein AM10699_62960 [Acaryochloris marina MBIC10699]
MVGQKYVLKQLKQLAPVKTLLGWQTAQIRRAQGLIKSKDKTLQAPESHAVDGIALAASEFVSYQRVGKDSMQWVGQVNITPSPFEVIARPAYSRRQLHLMVPAKGGIRRKYGGSKIHHHNLRKGDLVWAEKKGIRYMGYVSGDTKTQVSVSDSNWKRIAQFSAKKVQLAYRSVGFLVSKPKNMLVLNASSVKD